MRDQRLSDRHEADAARTRHDALLRWAATVLVGLNAFYLLLVAFGNVTDYASNEAFVRHVLAMDTTNFGAQPGTALDPDVMWRAVTTPWLQTAGYVAIIAWEMVAAAVLVAATAGWVRPAACRSRRACSLSVVGLLMVVLLFFGGFICVGGEWFAMYRSTQWNGLEPAFRNTVLAVGTLLVVIAADDAVPRGV